MRVGLVRHLKVTQPFPTGWVTARDLQDWRLRYDAAPVGTWAGGGEGGRVGSLLCQRHGAGCGDGAGSVLGGGDSDGLATGSLRSGSSRPGTCRSLLVCGSGSCAWRG